MCLIVQFDTHRGKCLHAAMEHGKRLQCAEMGVYRFHVVEYHITFS